jgi:hypothetical protein
MFYLNMNSFFFFTFGDFGPPMPFINISLVPSLRIGSNSESWTQKSTAAVRRDPTDAMKQRQQRLWTQASLVPRPEGMTPLEPLPLWRTKSEEMALTDVQFSHYLDLIGSSPIIKPNDPAREAVTCLDLTGDGQSLDLIAPIIKPKALARDVKVNKIGTVAAADLAGSGSETDSDDSSTGYSLQHLAKLEIEKKTRIIELDLVSSSSDSHSDDPRPTPRPRAKSDGMKPADGSELAALELSPTYNLKSELKSSINTAGASTGTFSFFSLASFMFLNPPCRRACVPQVKNFSLFPNQNPPQISHPF